MPRSRKSLCWLLLLAAVAAPSLSGCSSTEPTVAYAVVESGMAGSIFNGAKHELDEADVQEARETESKTDYQELREAHEEQQVEQSQRESTGYAETGE
ncbi:MAG TPA: hypothetical protein VHT27_13110 [Solirubrobacteraceae bacterium]|jgi:hypothetical protein|nr:hypothetical protein [Solirubrobacteraceae bacterium]